MSALGQKATSQHVRTMSAFAPKADMPIRPPPVVFLGPSTFQNKHTARPALLFCCCGRLCSKDQCGSTHRARLAESRCQQTRCPRAFAVVTMKRAGCLLMGQTWRRFAVRSWFTLIPPLDRFADHAFSRYCGWSSGRPRSAAGECRSKGNLALVAAPPRCGITNVAIFQLLLLRAARLVGSAAEEAAHCLWHDRCRAGQCDTGVR